MKKILQTLLGLAASVLLWSNIKSITDFGDAVAILQEINNETPFDCEFYSDTPLSDQVSLAGQVVSGRIIRLRSARFESRPYLRAVYAEGLLRLVADGDNPDDPAAHFMLQQYVRDDGSSRLGIRTCLPFHTGQGVLVGWMGTGEVYFINTIINNDDQKWSQWNLLTDPGRAERIWLQNMWTNGYLEAGPRFDQTRVEGDIHAASKMQGDGEGKEWCDPWLDMASMPDGVMRIGTPLRAAQPTAASELEIEIVADPEFPEVFKPLAGGLGFCVSAQGDHTCIIGGKGEAYYIGVNDKKWMPLSKFQGSEKKNRVGGLKVVSIGQDKTLYALNQQGQLFAYSWPQGTWLAQGTQTFDCISVANSKNIWGITTDKKILQKTDSGWNEVLALPNGYPTVISVGIDGTVWLVSSDQKLYTWYENFWLDPSSSLEAISVSVGDANNVAILSPLYEPKRLIPGKDLQNWQSINAVFSSLAITSQGRVVALSGAVSDDGLQVLQGNLIQDSDIEPKNSFDPTPYRWPKRINGARIPASSSMDLARLGFTTKTGAGKFNGIVFKRNPEIRGYSYMKPEIDFVRGTYLSLGSMWGRGYAWLEKSFSTPGSATLVFRARTKAEGDLHVVFGEKVGNECLYRVIIGGDGNKVSTVLKAGETQVENPVTVDRDPRAATLPGAYELYWVSIDNGLIMAGRGFPGQNVFMARRDAHPPVTKNGVSLVRNVGFSSFKSIDPIAVEITEVVTMPALTFKTPGRVLTMDEATYTLKKSDASTWTPHQFRTPGEGGVIFYLQGQGKVRIRLGDDAKDAINQFNGYEVILSSQGPVLSQIRRNQVGKNTLVFENKLYGTPFNNSQPTAYWMSCNKGQVTVGYGAYGENAFMVWEDPNPLRDLKRVGFTCVEGQATITGVNLAPPLELGFADPQVSYQKQYDQFKMPTSLIVVEPIRLQMTQVGSSLRLINKLTNKSYAVGAAAGVGKTIPYRLSVLTDGSATYEQLNAGTETKQRIATMAGAMVLQGTANLIAMMAPGFALGGPIGIGVGLALGAGGIAAGVGAGKLQSSIEYAKTKDTEYVFTEDYKLPTPTGTNITSTMQQNKIRAQAELDKADLLSPETPDGFLALVKAYQNVVLYARNAFVADDEFIKAKVFSGLDQLAAYYQDKPLSMYNDLLNLFISAYNNMYLIDPLNPEDLARRQAWSLAMTDISTQLFAQANAKGITVQGLYGQYLWFNQPLPEEGRGLLTFEAKGLSDIMIAFSPEPFTNARNSDSELYELAIGAVDNTKTLIRDKSLAKSPMIVFTAEELRKSYLASHPGSKNIQNGMATPREFSTYAINIHDGRIAFWQNDEGDIPLFEWQDPYPLPGVTTVGLSCWNTAVTFRNVQVAPSLLSESAPRPEDEVATETPENEVATDRPEDEVATQSPENEVAPEEPERQIAQNTGSMGASFVRSSQTLLPLSVIGQQQAAAEAAAQEEAVQAAQVNTQAQQAAASTSDQPLLMQRTAGYEMQAAQMGHVMGGRR